MNKKGELARNTLIILIGKICTQFISFFLLPLYTSILISSEFGLVDLVTTYIGLIVPVITLQLESSLFRYLVDVRSNEKEKKIIISNVFISATIQTIICMLVFFVISNFIYINYKYYIFGIVIATIFSNLLLQTARGLGDNVGYSIGSVIAGSLTIIFNLIFLVLLKIGPKGMFLSTAMANLLSSIYLGIRIKINRFINYEYLDKKIIEKLLKYSMPLIPNGIIWWIINVSDRTIISIFLGNSANGIYAISNKFSGVFITIYNIFNTSWTESASLHIDADDRDEFFSSTISLMFKLFSCMCLGIIAYMPLIFRIMINEQYSDSYNYIPILMLSSLFNVIVGLISVVYVAKKLTKEIAKTSFWSGVINIGSNLIMIKFIGIYAASLSTLLSFMVIALYRYIDVQKYVKIRLSKKLIIQTIIIFLITIFIYYKNNIILNVFGMILVTVYSVVINKGFILQALEVIKGKLKRYLDNREIIKVLK